MTDTYFAAKISKELPELQSSDAIWYKICRIQVKMKCIFRRSFTFGSFSCVLPMHLINITNSISITHFLFFKPTKCFCHHQTHHSSSKYNYCSKPCQLNCVFHDIFFSFLFYCSVIVVPFFFFFFDSASYITTSEVIRAFRTLDVSNRLHRLLIMNVVLFALFCCCL